MIRQLRPHILLAASLALVASASAQSFNVDVGANLSSPLPAVSYGAAALQPGFWSGVPTTAQTAVALKNLTTNAVTTVTIRPVGGYGDFVDATAGWTGDERALMTDASDVANAGTPPTGGLITWTIAGLAAGNYAIYTYAVAPDFPATYATTISVTGALEGPQVCTGAWPGPAHVLGVSYARHTLTISAGQNVTVLTSNAGTNPATSSGTVNGFQIVRGSNTPATGFCDGSACLACGNNGASGAGCGNSVHAAGALLASSGTASIGADSLVLTAWRVPGPSLFFQADGLSSATAFGDGQLCASVGIVRLGVVFPTADAVSYPGGSTPAPISVAGAPIAAGNTKHYQCWYRDAAAFCTPSTYNTTNGVSLVWGP